jgi:hypothetical protein
MKSAFGSKRKARKIQVDDDDDQASDVEPSPQPLSSRKSLEAQAACLADHEKPADHVIVASTSSATLNPGRKAFKKSSLRQSINFDDEEENQVPPNADGNNKPTIGRPNSTIKKKKPASSRLSFGPGEIISGDAAEALEDEEIFTSKKAALPRRNIESSSFRKSISYQGLPTRDEEEERPSYSKDYLNELKSSTPTTPKNLNANVEEDSGLDELDGAMVVDDENFAGGPAAIPSEADIREKKERRARLAHEQDFISLNDEGDGSQLSLLRQRKKPESRLVREDEDLGEGFDEFVDDGRISLGKKQEREAKRRRRKEMADMIHHAEGSSDEESDSEAETRAAYEAAQTRAGMDGLHKPGDDVEASSVQVPSRIIPLPGLAECLEHLQTTMSTMEQEMQHRHENLANLEREKNEILAREVEVQELLKQAGARYSALKNDSIGAATTRNGLPERMADRGLESFGNTPTARPEVEDEG